MRILGISSMFHDAAVTVIESTGIIRFAGHAERYSKEKNDPFLHRDLIKEALSYGTPDYVVFHEKTWAKRLRNIRAGAWSSLREPSQQDWIKDFYTNIAHIPQTSYWHHETHAAAGVLTSNLDSAAVMVIDAIGEFDTASIWHWCNGKLKKKHSVWFPSSLGLFYSAVTAHVGLKPMEDEYILMGMAAYGDPSRALEIKKQMLSLYFKPGVINLKVNLQRGLTDSNKFKDCDPMDIALAAQWIVEEQVCNYAQKAKQITGESTLVFMGGVALNCVANSLLYSIFDNLHIMPNPGDAGSSLGAAALHYYNLTGNRPKWDTPYLGTNMIGKYPVQKALASLERNEIFGIANGRAEFGPRALGNRSLMADPRGSEIKDRMNEIKKRQKFRPFAPVIMEEHVHEYFEMPNNCLSPYMQVVAKCTKPREFPAIVHADGTSRVQTVNATQHPGLYELLSKFYERTGCPMLVNTSLNIKGQPIVNDESDAIAFANHYNLDVHILDSQ